MTLCTVAPFQPGEAVLHITKGKRCNSIAAMRHGTVINAHDDCVNVLLSDGKRITTYGHKLTYLGCCEACERPAIVIDTVMVCPECGQPANTIPTPEMLPRLLPQYRHFDGYLFYYLAVAGLANDAAWQATRKHN